MLSFKNRSVICTQILMLSLMNFIVLDKKSQPTFFSLPL